MIDQLMNHPGLLAAVAFVAMWLASFAGLVLRNSMARAGDKRSEDYDLVVGATLTLLGLIIGFTFSMAISRYEQRKTYEEGEANTIGTEYLRADVLPAADAANVHRLLVAYLGQRIAYYAVADPTERAQINQRTDQLEAGLWSGVRMPAMAQPTGVTALAVAGMNDVIDARGFTQAAMGNRIPVEAWVFMTAVALCCNVLLGYGSRSSKWGGGALALVLPLMVSISFLLIADIDSPWRGLIQVGAPNLESLAQSLSH